MRWCVRCGDPITDGRLLCSTCVPPDQLRQDAKINMDTSPCIVLEAEGGILASRAGAGTTRVHAREVPEGGGITRSRLRAVEKVEWIHDRQQFERRVWLFDHHCRAYSETCFDLATGEVTWGPKLADLDDQHAHWRGGSGAE